MNIIEYAQREGYLTDEWLMKNKPTDEGYDGNALLYTGTLLALAQIRGQLTVDIRDKIVASMLRFEVAPGLFKRAYNDDNQARDDYIGILAGCSLSQRFDVCERIYKHGKESGWIYNIEPMDVLDYNYRFDRYPGFIPTVKLSVLESLGMWEQAMLAGDMIVTSFKPEDDTSGKLLDSLVCLMLDRSHANFGAKIGSWVFQKRVDIHKSYSIYFSEKHPFAVATRD